jgi:DNA processing protein
MSDHLTLAVAMFNLYGTPAKVSRAIGNGGIHAAAEITRTLTVEELSVAQEASDELVARDIQVTFLGEPSYPARLASLKSPPAVLFTWGNQSLLNETAVGMCGSRNVTDRGLRAAQQCGTEVASHGLMIVSGYARGVDTETHLAALRSGGCTAIVLAEGITHFRRKRAFSGVEFDPNRIVVLSQFSPKQAWNVGAAMTRNRVIVGLGTALVVIEAGETGGTLDAGRQAIQSGRPVLALEFSEDATPAGNRILHDLGAIPIRSRQQLTRVLREIGATSPERIDWQQLSLL